MPVKFTVFVIVFVAWSALIVGIWIGADTILPTFWNTVIFVVLVWLGVVPAVLVARQVGNKEHRGGL